MVPAPHTISASEKEEGRHCHDSFHGRTFYCWDEPTSGLDPRSTSKFINILYALKAQGKTLLIVTHDIFLAQEVADRVLVFSEETADCHWRI